MRIGSLAAQAQPSFLCLPVYLSVCLPVYLSVCLSVCLSSRPQVSRTFWYSVFLRVVSFGASVLCRTSVKSHFVRPSDRPSTCLSVCLFMCVRLSVCLSVPPPAGKANVLVVTRYISQATHARSRVRIIYNNLYCWYINAPKGAGFESVFPDSGPKWYVNI